MRSDALKSPTTRWLQHGLLVLLAFLVLLPWAPAADEPASLPGLVATLKGHENFVYGVAFSPDGKYAVTGSFDRTIRVWESATGKLVREFGGNNGHQRKVLSVAVSPQGTLLASSGEDNRVLLWDFPSGTPIHTYDQGQQANAVAITLDGKRLAGAGKDGIITIWDTATNKELFQLKGHQGPVNSVSFNPAGQYLVSSGEDETVRLWNAQNGQALAVFHAHAGKKSMVRFSPGNNNLFFSAGEEGSLQYWNLPPNKSRAISQPHADEVQALALSPNYQYIVSGGKDKVVRVSNYSNGQTFRSLAGAPAPISAVAMAPNNRLIAAGTEGAAASDPFPKAGRLLLWQNNGKLLRQVIAHPGPVTGVHFHPGSNQLLSVGSDGLLKQWALPTVADRRYPHPAPVLAAVPSADRQRIFTAGQDKIVRTWVINNPRQPERQYSGHTAEVTAVAISPNNRVLCSGSADRTLRFWNQGNGQTQALIGGHEGKITSLSFHGNNQQVLSASEDGSLKLWQVPQPPRPPMAHSDQVTSAALSPDGNSLLTGSNDKQVRLWNVTNSQLIRTFGGNTLAVHAVAMSRNGARVASGGADQSVRVWETGSGKEVKKFEKLGAVVQSVALSPDGNLAAAGLANNTLLLLDLTPPKDPKKPPQPRPLAGHTGVVQALRFNSKGDRLLSGSADRTVRQWDVAGGKVVSTLTHGGPVTALSTSADEKILATASTDKTVKLWTLADGKLTGTITTPAAVNGVSLSPDGQHVIVAGQDNQARLYSTDGQLEEFFSHAGPVTGVAFHNDNKSVLSVSADKTARFWTGSLLWQARTPGPVRQAILSPNSALAVSVGDDKVVRIWNASDGKPLSTLPGASAALTGVGISADNLKVAAAGADKVLRVWAVPKPGMAGPKPVEIPLPGAATSLTLSNDGKRVAVGLTSGQGGEVRLYDTVSGLEMQLPVIHKGPVHGLAFLSDNRTLLSASADKTCVLADANVLRVLDTHPGGTSSVMFHNSGTQALTAGVDKTAKIWDLNQGKLLRTFGPLAEPVTAAVYSRDYSQVALAAGKTVQIFNANDGKALTTITQATPVTSLALSPDKTRLVTGGTDNLARIWDLASGKVLQAFRHEGPVVGVAYYNDNRIVISASTDKTVQIHTANVVRVVDAGSPVRSLTTTMNGSHVVTGGADGKARLWNAGNGNKERTFEAGNQPIDAVAVSYNNQLVAVGGADQTVRAYQFGDGKLVKAWPAPAPLQGFTFTPDNLVLVGSFARGGMQSWSVQFNYNQPPPETFGQLLMAYEQPEAIPEIQFPRSGNEFYSAGPGATVRQWKIPSDRPIRTFNHRQMVDTIAFHPKGEQLATGGHDGQIRLFDVNKGNQIRAIAAHQPQQQGYIYCLAWSPDGKYLVSGSYDKSMKLWDAASGKMVREFKAYNEKNFPRGHREAVFCIAFSPDGRFLASGSSDRTIKIWNVSNGQVVRELVNPTLKTVGGKPAHAHPGWIYGVRYTPDGKYLVSAGRAPRNQGYLAVWEAGSGKMLSGRTLDLGPFYSEAVSSDGKNLILGSGGIQRSTGEPLHKGYVVQLSAVMK
jgi:WD40 repeat protein